MVLRWLQWSWMIGSVLAAHTAHAEGEVTGLALVLDAGSSWSLVTGGSPEVDRYADAKTGATVQIAVREGSCAKVREDAAASWTGDTTRKAELEQAAAAAGWPPSVLYLPPSDSAKLGYALCLSVATKSVLVGVETADVSAVAPMLAAIRAAVIAKDGEASLRAGASYEMAETIGASKTEAGTGTTGLVLELPATGAVVWTRKAGDRYVAKDTRTPTMPGVLSATVAMAGTQGCVWLIDRKRDGTPIDVAGLPAGWYPRALQVVYGTRKVLTLCADFADQTLGVIVGGPEQLDVAALTPLLEATHRAAAAKHRALDPTGGEGTTSDFGHIKARPGWAVRRFEEFLALIPTQPGHPSVNIAVGKKTGKVCERDPERAQKEGTPKSVPWWVPAAYDRTMLVTPQEGGQVTYALCAPNPGGITFVFVASVGDGSGDEIGGAAATELTKTLDDILLGKPRKPPPYVPLTFMIEGGRLAPRAADADAGISALVGERLEILPRSGVGLATVVRLVIGYGGGGFAYDAESTVGLGVAVGPITIGALVGAGADNNGIRTSDGSHVDFGLYGEARGLLRIKAGGLAIVGSAAYLARMNTDEIRYEGYVISRKRGKSGLHVGAIVIDYRDVGIYTGLAVGLVLGPQGDAVEK